MSPTRAVRDGRPGVVFVLTDAVSVRFVEPIAVRLRETGVRVGLVANLHGRALPAESLPHFDWYSDVAMGRSVTPLRDAANMAQLWRIFRRERPALVHASTPKAGMLGTIAARLSGVPSAAYQVRGLRYESATGLVRWILMRMERLTTSLADLVIFNSESLREKAEADGLVAPGTGVVVGRGSSTGVEVDDCHHVDERKLQPEPVLAFVGRICVDKGAQHLTQIVDLMRVEFPRLRLFVLGTPDPADRRAVDLVRHLEEHGQVDVLGYVPDVAHYLRRADLLIFPSRREGLPNAVLEAQSVGTPVVGFRATGTVDAVIDGETAILVPVGDVAAIATEAASLLTDSNRWLKLSTAGMDFVRSNFSSASVLDANRDLLLSLLSFGDGHRAGASPFARQERPNG